MRPERIELAGFTTFREPTVLDLSDVELFALTGPTGSGKTSLLDALCFALYGSVPRFGRRAVEPVVSLGLTEARVLLAFTVDGSRYTAARVVRRTRAGATTAEARLEGGPAVVSGAKEVTAAVESLLGLEFEQFTKSVVLPQGEFAAFLHDQPAERQELLKRLLDLDVYARVRDLAGKRREAAAAAADLLERQVAELADATEDAEAELVGRLDELVRLRGEVESATAGIAAAEEDVARRARRAEELAGNVRALRDLAVPPGVDGIAAARQDAASVLAARTEEDARTRADGEAAQADLAALPDEADLRETIRLRAEHAEYAGRRDTLERAAEAAREEEKVATARASQARLHLDDAEATRRDLELAHQAHVLRAALVPGEPCPVCLRPTEAVPSGETPGSLDVAAERLTEARRRADAAVREEAGATKAAAMASERLAEHEAALAVLTDALRDRLPEAEEVLGRVRHARSRVDAALAAERESRRRLDEARRVLDAVRESEDEARTLLHGARDGVATLGPPAPGRAGLAADWEALVAWARETAARLGVEASEDARALEKAREGLGARRAALDGLLAARGLVPREGRWRDAVVEAVAAASQRLETVRERRARAARLVTEARGRRIEAELAKALALHLRADGFEGWLLAEAQSALVAGANGLLGELSGDAYSLEAADRDIVVVDHRNAGERRSVRTLSGGETFLVSLALALALGEQISLLSAAGTSRLESLFLDEGFGTLDSDTLDTVAAVVADLGAQGRMVGLITHVTELAEMVPVRFEVRKGPAGSTVERVEA